MDLTVAFITARKDCKFDWFIDSLKKQLKPDDCIDVIWVDANCEEQKCWFINPEFENQSYPIHILHTPPKPTVWQGQHRLTKENWWAASNARNTAICLCQTKTIAFVDDRTVLMDGWMDAVKYSHTGGYIVFGSYEKRINMVDGDPQSGTVIGKDHRDRGQQGPEECLGSWMFGCTFAMPLEWALKVNGFEELCDSLSGEDSIFGQMLQNNMFPMRFDKSMKVIEDRTISDDVMKRTDKGVSPNDKSHAAIAKFGAMTRAQHPWNLRQVREDILAGWGWPNVTEFPTTDWYDNQPIKEFS